MREYILTEKEREIIGSFLKKGVKLDGFRMLLLRAKRNYRRLKADLELIEKMMEEAK